MHDKKGHHLLIKRLFPQKDLRILSVCAPNNRASKHMRQNLTEMKGQIEKSKFRVGDFILVSQYLLEK